MTSRRGRLRCAAILDRHEGRIRRAVECLSPAPAWFREFRQYLGDPRMELGEFWARYAMLRMQGVPPMRWITTPEAARDFFVTSQYPLWRNIVHRRHSAWRRVLWTMEGDDRVLLEYGCGTAPISRWVSPRKPRWTYGLVDLDGPPRAFAAWWFGARDGAGCRYAVDDSGAGTMRHRVSVATALDVFEHLPDPLAVARDLVRALLPGGVLHWNFVQTDGTELDLATAAQRRETIACLRASLRMLYEEPDHIVSVKE